MSPARLLAASWLLAGAAGCDAGAQLPAIDAGALVTATFACDVPASAPSKGSCVTVPDAGVFDDDGGVFCNPVTNEPCAAGQTCDTTSNACGEVNGLACYGGNNSAELCALCSATEGPFCAAGLACTSVSGDVTACARYCCTDADCGSGRCAHTDGSGNALFGGLFAGLGECAVK
jgi:hypothetical protein